ncbi:unnamed protein product [Darwinula stevensoni]|uniref:Uncharacterized protein n=1 Tax=Darwinula stevensoni TaxID=69355 RepID=A0A7R8WZY8_9CRUS|nr:unnamed protein product [Darwinula stevensoni]CAG0878676.1 unnamed protein product [Darwinula stevensoni]
MNRRGNLDIRDYLKIYMGANRGKPLKEAAGEYVRQHYPNAYTRAYSLPEGYILNPKEFKKIEEKARKYENVEMPTDNRSVAMMFNCLKDAFKHVPSLTLADYAFTDTLLKGINKKQKEKFIKDFGVPKEDLEPGDHDVFGVGISGNDIVGMFFQVKKTPSNVNPKTVIDSFAKATRQVNKDMNIFRTMCGEFLSERVKLAGFPALPMLSQSDLLELSLTCTTLKCKSCRERILTAEDLESSASFKAFLTRHGIVLQDSWCQELDSPVMKTFKEIFDLYVCAASAVDLPRNPIQLHAKSEEQMQKMLVILTPQQRELVKSESKVVLLSGLSGTGKTFVLKERALLLAEKGDVLVINIAGGHLTNEFRQDFQEKGDIEVVDGRMEGLEESIDKLKRFLEEKGQGKHILVDEVPITLGFLDIIAPEAISNHWAWIADLRSTVKSVTISFRPNDQSYTRDFLLEEVKPAGYNITVLDTVKRNTEHISKLFLAIGDFSRRVFVSSQRSFKMDWCEPAGEYLPCFIVMTSCQALHRNCRNKLICEVVRASYAIHEESSNLSKRMPVFIVVDDEWRRNVFVNIFTFLYPQFRLMFSVNSNKFREKPTLLDSFPLIVVTEVEMMGCHPKNVSFVLDFPRSQWQNYCRLIATTGENKILVIEEEEWRMGKFSFVSNDIAGKKTKKGSGDPRDLNASLEMVWQEYKEKDIQQLDVYHLSVESFPEVDLHTSGRDEEEDADVEKMLKSRFSLIFGYPVSGKSRRIDLLIGRISGRVLILQSGSLMSRQIQRQHWSAKSNLDLVRAQKIESLQDIFDNVERAHKEKERKIKELRKKEEREGKVRKRENEEEGEMEESGVLVVVVDDCPLFSDFSGTIEKLNEMRVKLILAFKPHSENMSEFALSETLKLLEYQQDCTVIVIQSQPTTMAFMKHIRENETPNALNLDAKNLSLSAKPATIVPGPSVQYIDFKTDKCSGRHLGYICYGDSTCGNTATFLSSLIKSDFFKGKSEYDLPHILVSHEGQVTLLREKFRDTLPDVKIEHLQEFRGCEASVVISLNVSDDWLLEVISRSRTQLIVIDNLINHEHLWATMKQEGRVEAILCSPDTEDDISTLLRLDDQEVFLECPSWDEVGIRIGEEALRRQGVLDDNTGAILPLSPATWQAINSDLSPTSSSPFADWGYTWSGMKEEVPCVDEDRRSRILDILRQKGVEWEEEDASPTPLETRRIRRAFFPQEEGRIDWMGILLVWEESISTNAEFIPVVHHLDRRYRQNRLNRLDQQFRLDRLYRKDRLYRLDRLYLQDHMDRLNRLYRQDRPNRQDRLDCMNRLDHQFHKDRQDHLLLYQGSKIVKLCRNCGLTLQEEELAWSAAGPS